MAVTYDSIATVTLGSPASTINITSIPTTFTDLRLVVSGSASQQGNVRVIANGSTATHYFQGCRLDNSSLTNEWNTIGNVSEWGGTGRNNNIILDIMSYSSTVLRKIALTRQAAKMGNTLAGNMGLGNWYFPDTGQITSLAISIGSGNFDTGTKASLYGILRA